MAITVPLNTGKARTAGATSLDVSFGSLPSAGDAIIAAVANWKSTTRHTFVNTEVTDNQGGSSGSYVEDLNIPQYVPESDAGLVSRLNISSPSGTFTVTYTTNPSESIEITMGAIAARAVMTSSAKDVSATNTGVASPLNTGTTASTAQADELAVAFGIWSQDTNPATVGTPSGYTVIWTEGDWTYMLGGAYYKILSAIGTQNASWTVTPVYVNYWAAGIVTYKGTGVPGVLWPRKKRLRPWPFAPGIAQ